MFQCIFQSTPCCYEVKGECLGLNSCNTGLKIGFGGSHRLFKLLSVFGLGGSHRSLKFLGVFGFGGSHCLLKLLSVFGIGGSGVPHHVVQVYLSASLPANL